MAMHAYNTRTQQMGKERLGVQYDFKTSLSSVANSGRPQLHSKFWVILDRIRSKIRKKI